ncbi:Tfp pilus assembly protein PilF [Paramagnetospirillum magnetotacticum MS-1]|uniref:Tfp pilus assembly protein PilF n=1 Tax=Paramagnetospirillum magnetotacticum MS-1 TaxID=272627 RepID=A0A0C2YR15_PARME|nr:SPOR domain-containing protein [Paramagnetospirillum magnetotacticum]KIL97120.1 Tfp pilus assembly protein PilF [Paramagnetospirillum magnetotacticum MS-1]
MGLTGCGGIVGIPPAAESWPSPQQEVAPEAVRYPEVRLSVPTAIAADPEAQRFLLLRQLAEAGLVGPDEAATRRNANIGALAPYSAPPPAAGLGRPVALRDIADRLARLSVPAPGMPPSVRQAERDFLMDSLLPAEPVTRTPPARKDSAALSVGRRRAEDLARLGLLDHEEYQREMATIIAAERELANAPPPPPPPPPKKKKAPAKKPVPDGGVPGATRDGDIPGGTVPFNPKGTLGLHLLSMASPTTTDKAVEALKKEFPELAAMEFKAVKTDIPDLGTTYRLMAGPLSGTDAEALCRALRGKGQSCAITNF